MSNLGYFGAGDRIQLTDPKGKLYSFTITPGKEWHTHKGWITHDDLIGMPEGSVVSTTAGLKFTAFKPLLADYVLTMPRGATIVYPKDAAMIVGVADIYPGARVLEAGVGSGALTISLLRAAGPTGKVHSVERRADFADNARSNVDAYFEAAPENWSLVVGDLQDQEFDSEFDRVILVLWLRLFRLRCDLYEMCGSLGHLDPPRISTRNLIVRIIRQEQLFVGVDRVVNLHK